MKKLTVLLVSMMLAGVAFADMIVPKIGYDFSSQQKWEWNGRSVHLDTDPGVTVGADYIHPINDLFGIGGGFEYQFERNAEMMGSTGGFNFLPLYVTGIITPFKQDCCGFKPYGRLNLGYNFLMGNDDFKGPGTLKNGLYWAIGIGTSYQDFIGEVTYATNMGQIEAMGRTFDITYSKVALNVGYKFELE